MNRSVLYAVTIVVCMLLEAGVAPVAEIGGARCDFLLVAVLVVSMGSGVFAGSVTGFLLGIYADLASNGTVGVTSLVFCLVALVVGLLAGVLETDSPAVLAGVAIFSSLADALLTGFANLLTGIEAAGFAQTMLTCALPSFFYTAIVSTIALVAIALLAGGAASGGSGMGGGLSSGGSPSGGQLRF